MIKKIKRLYKKAYRHMWTLTFAFYAGLSGYKIAEGGYDFYYPDSPEDIEMSQIFNVDPVLKEKRLEKGMATSLMACFKEMSLSGVNDIAQNNDQIVLTIKGQEFRQCADEKNAKMLPMYEAKALKQVYISGALCLFFLGATGVSQQYQRKKARQRRKQSVQPK